MLIIFESLLIRRFCWLWRLFVFLFWSFKIKICLFKFVICKVMLFIFKILLYIWLFSLFCKFLSCLYILCIVLVRVEVFWWISVCIVKFFGFFESFCKFEKNWFIIVDKFVLFGLLNMVLIKFRLLVFILYFFWCEYLFWYCIFKNMFFICLRFCILVFILIWNFGL